MALTARAKTSATTRVHQLVSPLRKSWNSPASANPVGAHLNAIGRGFYDSRANSSITCF